MREVKVGDVLYAYYAKQRQFCAFPVHKVNKKSLHVGWYDVNDDLEDVARYHKHGLTYTGNKIADIGKSFFFTKKEAFDNPITWETK